MGKSKLFQGLDALFTKKEVQDAPSAFMLHRFLASDPDYARIARQFNLDIRDDDLAFLTWQTLLPRMGSGAPYFHYTAPGKPDEAHPVVEKLMSVESMSRDEAEEVFELIELQGEVGATAQYYGLELEDE